MNAPYLLHSIKSWIFQCACCITINYSSNQRLLFFLLNNPLSEAMFLFVQIFSPFMWNPFFCSMNTSLQRFKYWCSLQISSGWAILFKITIKSFLQESFPLLRWIERFQGGFSVNTTISGCLEKDISFFRYVPLELPRTSSCLSQSHLLSYWKLSFLSLFGSGSHLLIWSE